MDYVHLLQDNDLKATPQRLVILKELDTRGHICVDELYRLLEKSFPSISLATIYKNINLMIQKYLVQEVKIPNEKSVYELTKEEHAHVVCSKCNNILDINLNIDNLISKASDISHFKLQTSSIVFNGLCPDCQ